MEVIIDMDYLVHSLHLKQDVAKVIYNLREGDRKAYQRCLSILRDPGVSRHKDGKVLSCLTAKLNGENSIII